MSRFGEATAEEFSLKRIIPARSWCNSYCGLSLAPIPG